MTQNTQSKMAEIFKAAQQKTKVVATKPESVKQVNNEPELSAITFNDLISVSVTVTPNLQLIDYSPKAFVITGDTYPIRDQLHNFGGIFKYNWKCGKGWMFPKSKAYTIRKALKLIS